MPRKRRALTKFSRAEGQAIQRLPAIERMDAIALEMFGPPDAPNHNAKLAELLGVSDRWMRQIRATGKIHPNLLAILTLTWKLWRGEEGERRRWARSAERKAAARARIRAIREGGIAAVFESRRS